MDKLKSRDKPFDISKWEVLEAYREVKKNQGAPGVDGQSIEDFEKDLRGNLYKIWNRMSSGTYFPPAVRAVQIPKQHGGGTRMLGIPTVADRVAQTVVARHLGIRVDPVFHEDSYGYRPRRSALDAVETCRQRCWKRDWVIDLDIQKCFDSVRWDLIVKAVDAHADAVWVKLFVEAVASRTASTARRLLADARPGDPSGVGGLARAGEPVHALRVRHLAHPGISGDPVRAVCR
ncbi:reverse transcriptase domain-containing protein [Streptomyces sp. NPDC002659]|uniref:reverse transcriptase domain-containing protein n=1 Tax=Streptomyces sp. NPDC002659 TaxID=3364656 RepID=UPI00367BD250